MQVPGSKTTKTARVWAYVREERPWSGAAPPGVWCRFTVNRKGMHPVDHLLAYSGWVHADGYSRFNGLFADDKVDEMACMAHVRRKFVDVHQAQGGAIAEEAVRRIVALGRKNWLFASSEGGGKAMAIAFTLTETAKLNGVDP